MNLSEKGLHLSYRTAQLGLSSFFLLLFFLPAQSQLLFKSGFEEGVYLSNSRDDILGGDGMDWNRDLESNIPEVKAFKLNFVGGQPPEDVFVEFTQDPDDENNRVLFFENIRSRGTRGTSRVQNELNYQESGSTFKEGFIRYRMRFPEHINYLREYPENLFWFTIMEWWEHRDASLDGDPAGKSRVSLMINKDEGAGKELYWRIKAEKMQPQRERFDDLFDKENRSAVVPIGEWFTLETYFKSGNANNGRVIISIVTADGERTEIFNIQDQTQHPSSPKPLRGWQFFKLYTSAEVLDFMREACFPVAAYYDDIEYYGSIPE